MRALRSLSRSEQDYLKAVYALSPGGEPAPTSHLARRLAVSAPSVTNMLGRLAADGLVKHSPRAGASLRREGGRGGLAFLGPHRILETSRVRVLGPDWSAAHDEAEVLEHG